MHKPGCGVIIGIEDADPVFGMIKEIFVFLGDVYFTIETFKTVYYDEHYHAYIVEATSDMVLIKSSKLPTYDPLHFRSVINLTMPNYKSIVLKSV